MPRTNMPPLYEDARYLFARLQLRSIPARREYLRRRLRRSPLWIEGHLHLAELTGKMIFQSDQAPHQREYSTIRLCCQAAKRLLGSESLEIPAANMERSRQLQRAEMWLACLDFFQKRYEMALSRFERVLEDGNVVQLTRGDHYLALEYAASAALVLGKEEVASEFLSRVPERERSRDLQMLKKLLIVRENL